MCYRRALRGRRARSVTAEEKGDATSRCDEDPHDARRKPAATGRPGGTPPAARRGGGSAAEALAARALSAVDDAVRAQVAAGLDVVNDGEQGRTDYSTYIKDRLTGFEGEHADQVMGADLKEF